VKWGNNGYEVELVGNESDFYCSILIDGEEYAKYFPDFTEGKSDFEKYLNQFDCDLFAAPDIYGNKLWIPMYYIEKIDLNDKWAVFDEIFSTYSEREAKETFRALDVASGFKLELRRLNRPNDFDQTGESEYDNYTVIDE